MSELPIPTHADWPHGRVGIVAIVGRPNVGKSTFLNKALAYRLTAVSNKPQTTRRHWRGVLSEKGTQIIFVDTPGVHEGVHRLGVAMMQSVRSAITDADLCLLIADPTRPPGEEDGLAASLAAAGKTPIILIINKCDAATKQQIAEATAFFQPLCHPVAVLRISAMTGKGVDELLDDIRTRLPEGPFFYAEDHLTDSIQKDLGSELIREAAFNHLHDELPHSLAVEIEEWRDHPVKVRIRATLHVDHASQVPIVVGAGGERLKAITHEAVMALVEQLEQRIDLKLHVKATPNWRNNSRFLKELGLE